MSAKKELPIPIRMINIEVPQFSLFEEALEQEGELRDRVTIGYGAERTERVIGASVIYQLRTEETPLLQIQVICYFEIEEKAFKEQLQKADGLTLPQSFAAHLAALTVSTARGVLFTKTENTPFSKFLMGLINVEDIVTDDVSIDA